MSTYSEENLIKLRDYLEANAVILASQNRIRQFPYYPNNEAMRDYQWTIVDVPGLGRLEMYFTGSSAVLKINSVYADGHLVIKLDFWAVDNVLIKALNDKKVQDSESFFNDLK